MSKISTREILRRVGLTREDVARIAERYRIKNPATNLPHPAFWGTQFSVTEDDIFNDRLAGGGVLDSLTNKTDMQYHGRPNQ